MTSHRWVLRTLVLPAGALVVLLAGCASPVGNPAPSSTCGIDGGSAANACPSVSSVSSAAPAPEPNGPSTTVPDQTALPTELLGSWSGDDAQGQGSWMLTFAQDGEYRLSNDRTQQAVHGRAAAEGARLILQPDNAQAYAVAWSLGGGHLTIDGSVYLRVGGGVDGASGLVGLWTGLTNIYTTLQLSSDGSVSITDPVRGDASGTFDVSGHQLTLSIPGRGSVTYIWHLEGATLRLQGPSGQVTEFTRS